MNKNQSLPAFLEKRFESLPGVLSFAQVATFFGISADGVARRFERGTLHIRVVPNGGGLGVLAADLAKFLVDGIPQEQPPIKRRLARNPFGKVGKPERGRPSKAEVAFRLAKEKPVDSK